MECFLRVCPCWLITFFLIIFLHKDVHWENFISISFHIEWDMIVVTVFLSILHQMEIHLVQNRKEYCNPDHIPFNFKGNEILVFSVYKHIIPMTHSISTTATYFRTTSTVNMHPRCLINIETFISTRKNNYRIYFSKCKWCGSFISIKASSGNLNY